MLYKGRSPVCLDELKFPKEIKLSLMFKPLHFMCAMNVLLKRLDKVLASMHEGHCKGNVNKNAQLE